MNYSQGLLNFKIKALTKNLLLITAAIFGIIMGVHAQAIFTSSSSHSSFYLCEVPGSPLACGKNEDGQLGDGHTGNVSTPVQVNGLSGVKAIAASNFFTLFLKSDGIVWATGKNEYGQFGDGTTNNSIIPNQVSGLSDITGVAAGTFHSLFLKGDGTVLASGRNDFGQLGDGTTSETSTPVEVNGLSDITAISAGESHSLFLKSDGSVWASGRNDRGQLGDETNIVRHAPVQVSGLSGITAIAAGAFYSLFLKNDGSVWASGYNPYGQLGDGTYASKYTPVQLSALSDITAIAAGHSHSLFLKNDGTVWASGGNLHGELGVGIMDDTNTPPLKLSTPIQLNTILDVIAIAAGGLHSLFLKTDGSVWSCGENLAGQLGIGTTTKKYVPFQMILDECDSSVGVDEVNNNISDLSVYPNPANNSVVIESKVHSKQAIIKIYNATGQEVLQSSSDTYWDNDQSIIDISALSSGVYFIRLFDGENQGNGKFVKQ